MALAGYLLLGNLVLTLADVIAIYGIGNAIGNLSQSYINHQDYLAVLSDPTVVILWLIYLILAPTIFFLPLGVAHNAMGQAKAEYI